MFTNPRILKTYITDMPDPVIVKNKISGTVNEANNSDKSVWVYDRDSGELLAHTMVDRETRKWEVYLDTAHNDESLFIVCRDEGGDFNGDMFDYVSLCTVEYEPNPNTVSLTEFPEETFVKEPVFPSTTMQYYKCTVPELKGNITKVSQNSENVLNYVDANDNIVSNDVTTNSVLVNDNSIVLNKEINKYLKGNFLKTWRKNIFNDNSEVFHPVFNGKVWEDFYSKSPFLFSDGGHTSYAGRYGDMALAAERTNLDFSGSFDISGVDAGFHKGASSALTISFHGLMNGMSNDGWINGTGIYEWNRLFSLCNPVNNNVYFSIGSSVHGKTRNNTFYTTVGSSSVTTTVSDAMYNGNPFRLVGIWHHYVVVITTTNLKVYIDNILIVDRNFSSTLIPDDFTFIIGRTKCGGSNNYYKCYQGGRISGLRAFNREVTVQEVETLYNDRPIIEQDVSSIKGMEYARWNTMLFSQDKSFLFLGGCPFAPLYEYFLYKETYPDGKETYCYASPEKYIDILSPGRSPLLRENYVTMNNMSGASQSSTDWTGLASRPDVATDQDMGVNMNDIEVEIRCRVRGWGYLFKIGNYNNGSLYIYKESAVGRFTYRFRNRVWDNLYYAQPANGWDSWIRVRWYENKLCIYEDDGTTLLGSATGNWNTFDNTLGQIAVGCHRGSGPYYSSPYDAAGVDGDISDVVIYKRGTMPSPERAKAVPPIEPVIYKEYKFGYERDGLAGLYLYEGAELEVADSIDGTSKVRAGTINRGLTIRNWTSKAASRNIKNVSVIAYYNIDSDWYYSNDVNLYSHHHLMYHVYGNHSIGFQTSYSSFYGMSNSVHAQASFVFDEWNMIAATIEGDSKLKALQSYTDGCRGIRVNNYNFNVVNNNTNNDYYIYIESTSWDTNYYKLGAATERIYMYDAVLPPSVVRNLYQNFNGAVYKDDMQVAFIEDNNNYPIYKDVPITKVTVKGKDNGQILTFAFTNNNEDYYIYSSGWKKIASTSGIAESEKWKVIATAMDDTANRMNIARVNSLTANQIAELYNAVTGIFNVAVGMKSDGTISPYFEDIHFNTEKIWLSRLYDLSEFSHTSYITKTFLQRFIKDGQPSGLKLYSHVSGYDGWQEIQPFAPVPNINQGVQNNGTVQFKVTFDATKHDANENTSFEVLIK